MELPAVNIMQWICANKHISMDVRWFNGARLRRSWSPDQSILLFVSFSLCVHACVGPVHVERRETGVHCK